MEGPQIQLYAAQLRSLGGFSLVRLGGERRHVVADLRGHTFAEPIAFGKLLFLRFADHSKLLRLHCLMFGDIRINRTRPGKRLTLRMSMESGDKVYLYLGAARLADADELDDTIRQRDIAGGKQPDPATLKRAAEALPNQMVCDALLDQQWFPGLGNKIKCEAMHHADVHPATKMGDLNDESIERLSEGVRGFTQHFESIIFRDGDRGTPKYQIFRRRRCGRCDGPVKNEKLGDLQRSSHYCPNCQPVPRN